MSLVKEVESYLRHTMRGRNMRNILRLVHCCIARYLWELLQLYERGREER